MTKILQADVKPGESLDVAYKRMAKRANQRLVRLERLNKQDAGVSGALTGAYNKAVNDIKRMFGIGKSRFNETKPPADVKAAINALKTFLNSESSTKTGIINIRKRQADTFNKKHGTDFTWKEIGEYFEKEKNVKIEKIMTYRVELEIVADIQNLSEGKKQGISQGVLDQNSTLSDIADFIESQRTRADEFKEILNAYKNAPDQDFQKVMEEDEVPFETATINNQNKRKRGRPRKQK